jgi:hypothetical protein
MKKVGLALVSMLSLVGCTGLEEATDVEAQASVGTQSQGLGCATAGDGKTTLRFINKCNTPVVFAGNGGMAGGTLAVGGEACRNIGGNTEHMISRRYWGFRQGEDPGSERYTLAEFGFNENFMGNASWDWFDISQVDAQNLPMKIVPYQLGTNNVCPDQTRACAINLLPGCPAVGQKKNSAGKVISCFSPERDNPNSAVAKYFDSKCSQAYSWSGDDAGSMAACNAEDFDIVFCPG